MGWWEPQAQPGSVALQAQRRTLLPVWRIRSLSDASSQAGTVAVMDRKTGRSQSMKGCGWLA